MLEPKGSSRHKPGLDKTENICYNKEKNKRGINMYEYYVESIYTGEKRIVFGYNVQDAFRRANLAPIEWGVVYVEYVD